MKGRYKGEKEKLKKALGPQAIEELVNLFKEVQDNIKSRTIGENHDEGYVLNLRHLFRMVEGFISPLSPALSHKGRGRSEGILQTLHDTLGVSLRAEDKRHLNQLIKNRKFGDIRITDADIQAFQEKQRSLTLGQVAEELNLDQKKLNQFIEKYQVTDIPTTVKYFRDVVKALQAGEMPWLKGPAGTGKTQVVLMAMEALGMEGYRDTLTPQTDDATLKGEIKPVVLKGGKLGFKHVPAALVKALKKAQELHQAQGERAPLVGCFLDEAGFGKADVIEELNTLLDREGSILIVNEEGETEELKR